MWLRISIYCFRRDNNKVFPCFLVPKDIMGSGGSVRLIACEEMKTRKKINFNTHTITAVLPWENITCHNIYVQITIESSYQLNSIDYVARSKYDGGVSE
jgi:hypothetical protein